MQLSASLREFADGAASISIDAATIRELLRKLVLASSNPGDLIADPFSGSGTTSVVAEQLGRRWLACDCSKQYNEWAIERLDCVVRRSEADWIRFDAETAQRRESIR